MTMDRHTEQQHRSAAPLVRPDRIAPQKLNISYLLNDPTTDDRSDALMRDAASSRDLRSHRSRSIAGSSRRLHVPSSVRDRHLPPPPTTHLPHQPTFFCPICNELFHHVSLFEEHKRGHQSHQIHQSHHHQRTRSFGCEQCGASFSEKGNLNKKEKPWPCSYCNNHFAFRDALNRHVDAVHLDLRPYGCTECIAKFKKRAHLQRHLATCHRSSSSNPQ